MLSQRDLFASVKAGDLLIIPHENTVIYSVVLRRDGAKIFLSCPHEDMDDLHTHTANPIRWDYQMETLLDDEGDIPWWYAGDVSLERGGASKEAHAYAQIPREENVQTRVTELDRQTCDKDGVSKVLEGLLRNKEASSPEGLISLALDVLGVKHNGVQLYGITLVVALLRKEAELGIASDIAKEVEQVAEQFCAMEEKASAGRLN